MTTGSTSGASTSLRAGRPFRRSAASLDVAEGTCATVAMHMDLQCCFAQVDAGICSGSGWRHAAVPVVLQTDSVSPLHVQSTQESLLQAKQQANLYPDPPIQGFHGSACCLPLRYRRSGGGLFAMRRERIPRIHRRSTSWKEFILRCHGRRSIARRSLANTSARPQEPSSHSANRFSPGSTHQSETVARSQTALREFQPSLRAATRTRSGLPLYPAPSKPILRLQWTPRCLGVPETELSALTRDVQEDRPNADRDILDEETAHCSTKGNTNQRGANCQITVQDANQSLRSVYPPIVVTSSTRSAGPFGSDN